MKRQLELALTIVLVICVVAVTALVARRELIVRHLPLPPEESLAPVRLANWHDYLRQGLALGPDGAHVQLMEFSDFECPYCGKFHKSLRVLDHNYPGQVAVTFVHFPLPMHRFAIPAARVAECANDQGRFQAMYDQLFEGQDQFGLKPWDDYATAAGVPDIAAFDACIKKTDPIPRVEEGKALGAKLDVKGTPTIIINGWKLGKPPTDAELDQMVQRVLAGKQPVDAKT